MFGKPSIEKLEEKRDIPGLLKLLKDKEWRTRADAVATLGRLREPSAGPALVAALQDSDFTVRQAAARVVGEMRIGEAVEPLYGLLNDRDDGARLAAIQALGRMVDRDEGGRMAGLQQNANPKIAAAAGKALLEINSRRGAPVVRVFVSSTFRDMQEERDYLVKHIFPELRQRCNQRGVELVEVDLRWGITQEQAERGEVLKICLDEIENCRPYFVGLLGSRYGWVPDSFPPRLLEDQAWVAQQGGRSVTELEILHGVLNNPQMEHRAFFHFRHPAWSQRLPEEQRAAFEAESEQSAARLADLKERIRKSGFPVNEGYQEVKALGQIILEQLWQAIQQDFPAESGGSDALRMVFEASHTRHFLGHEALLKELDAHLDAKGPPLLLYGEAGMGKTALMVNWVKRVAERPKPPFVLRFYIGETRGSSGLPWLLHSILAGLKERFHLVEEVPSQLEMGKLLERLPKALVDAARIAPVVLVLDGLDKLEDRHDALSLKWLPEVLPANLRLFATAGSQAMLEKAGGRKWRVVQMKPLEPAEVGRLVPAYLAQFRKSLSPALAGLIQAAPQAGSPLFLRSLLDELRQFGVHEALEQRLREYLQAPDTRQLFEKILARLEQDFERERPGLVGQALSLLYASRRGLREQELLELLGDRNGPLPYAYWSPLYLALKGTLTQSSGLLTFSHEPLREAVRQRYLPAREDENRARARIAEYFEKLDLLPGVPKEQVNFQMVQDITFRKVDETAWQLVQMQAWERLRELLSDARLVSLAWLLDGDQVLHAFRALQQNSPYNLAEMYAWMVDAPEKVEHAEAVVPKMADLFHAAGFPQQAFQMRERLMERTLESLPPAQKADLLIKQGITHYQAHELEPALHYVERAREQMRLAKDAAGLRNSGLLEAQIHMQLGDAMQALAAFTEEEKQCRKEDNQKGLGYSLLLQSGAVRALGQRDEALRLVDQAIEICTRCGAKDILELCLNAKLDMLSERSRQPT